MRKDNRHSLDGPDDDDVEWGANGMADLLLPPVLAQRLNDLAERDFNDALGDSLEVYSLKESSCSHPSNEEEKDP